MQNVDTDASRVAGVSHQGVAVTVSRAASGSTCKTLSPSVIPAEATITRRLNIR
jgi:hypothetical protein